MYRTQPHGTLKIMPKKTKQKSQENHNKGQDKSEPEPTLEPKLSAKEALFVRYYLATENSTESMRRMGRKESSAPVLGSRMLKRVKVQQALKFYYDARNKRLEITADNVLREVAKSALVNIADCFKWDEEKKSLVMSHKDFAGLPREVTAAMIEVTLEEKIVKIKFDKKKGYQELLLRHLGVLNDKMTVTVDTVASLFDGDYE